MPSHVYMSTVLCTKPSHMYMVKKRRGEKEQVRETITTSITGNLNGEKMTWRKKNDMKKWMTYNPPHSMMLYDIPSTNSPSDQQKSCICCDGD